MAALTPKYKRTHDTLFEVHYIILYNILYNIRCKEEIYTRIHTHFIRVGRQ